MTYNWQHPDWPCFVYDAVQCKTSVYQYALDAGRLSASVGQLLEPVQYDIYIDLMVIEACHTAAIEGEQFSEQDVEASIKNTLDMNHPKVHVENPRANGIGQLMVDVRRSFTEPLTKQKLLQWQQLVCEAPGQWRQSEDTLRLVCPNEKTEPCQFTPPPPKQIEAEIERFLVWYNQTNPMESSEPENTLCGPVRAAIAHLWFESIHPFDSGNGRVGRAIAEQVLAQDLGHPPMLSLSTQLKRYAKSYFNGLATATEASMDITPWVNWFTQSVLSAQKAEMHRVDDKVKRATL